MKFFKFQIFYKIKVKCHKNFKISFISQIIKKKIYFYRNKIIIVNYQKLQINMSLITELIKIFKIINCKIILRIKMKNK